MAAAVNPPSVAAAASAGAAAGTLVKRVTRHFIFGYGSLICPHSRSITAPSLAGPDAPPAIPCVVRNLERGWNARVPVRGRLPRRDRHHLEQRLPEGAVDQPRRLDGWTAVGVGVAPGGSCAGVLVEVDEDELTLFDVRETGYDRLPVSLEHVERVPGHHTASKDGARDSEGEMEGAGEEKKEEEEEHAVFRKGDHVRRMSSVLDSCEAGKGAGNCPAIDLEVDTDDLKIWVYIQRDRTPADRHYPITQSYVDIILRGCLSVSEAFARSFIDTTAGWWHDGDGRSGDEQEAVDSDLVDDDHHTWIDDRHFPLYIRSDPEYSREMGHVLDRLVKEHHPQALEKRRRY